MFMLCTALCSVVGANHALRAGSQAKIAHAQPDNLILYANFAAAFPEKI
jgi:hypothetical protein